MNGKPPSKEMLTGLDYKDSIVVCADGAYDYLSEFCVPDILVGDFDSLKKRPDNGDLSKLKAKKIIKLEVEKDFTDGHIAMLELIKAGADKIFIYGALGEPDHELSNYSLLLLAKEVLKDSVIVTERFKIYVASGEFSCPVGVGKIVSLVPFTDEAHILRTKGLKFSAFDEVWNKYHIKGISNVSTADAVELTLKSGAVLVFAEN